MCRLRTLLALRNSRAAATAAASYLVGLASLVGCETAVEPYTVGAPMVLWSAESPVRNGPVLVANHVIGMTRAGRVESRRRSDGEIVWVREIGTIAWSAPLLYVAGTVIVPAYQLHGLDPATGAIRWSFNGPDGRTGVSAPGFSGDTLYVADQGGIACALSASDGAEIWCVDLEEAQFTPLVQGDLVIYPTRGYVTGERTSQLGGGAVVALNRFTGAFVWRFELPTREGWPGSGGATEPGTVIEERLIIGSMSGDLYALDVASGDSLWSLVDRTDTLRTYPNPVVGFAGHVVTVRSDGQMEARDPATGAIRWTHEVAGLADPQRCGNYLCVAGGRMFVFDAGGATVWAYGGGSTGWGAVPRWATDSSKTFYVGITRNGTQTTFEAIRLPVEF